MRVAVPDSDVRTGYYGSVGALGLREPMLAVYLASHHDQQYDPWFSPESFWDRLLNLYAPGPDFGLVVAWQDDTMIGYAFGSPKDNSADIWEMTAHTLPEVTAPPTPTPIYFFREFAVSPEYQGKDYGRLLHDTLLNTRPERLAHLLVRQDNSAKQAYLHWGWHTVGQVQPFPDAPVMDAMVKILDYR